MWSFKQKKPFHSVGPLPAALFPAKTVCRLLSYVGFFAMFVVIYSQKINTP